MVPWLLAAFNELDLGVKEVPGPLSNERITEYLKSVGLTADDDKMSWCSAFVNWCLKKGGVTGTENPVARSFLKWGVPANDPPRLGSVAVFWRQSPDSWQGHVAFLIHEDPWLVTVLGGNQSNSVSIARYPRNQLLAFRWPSDG